MQAREGGVGGGVGGTLRQQSALRLRPQTYPFFGFFFVFFWSRWFWCLEWGCKRSRGLHGLDEKNKRRKKGANVYKLNP